MVRHYINDHFDTVPVRSLYHVIEICDSPQAGVNITVIIYVIPAVRKL